MSDQRSVTPFEQQVFNLLARDNPPHPVILSQLVASMDLRYITRLRSSIDGEGMNMLLCAAAEMHSTATGALADSTFKTNEEASDAAPRSSSANASSVDIVTPASTTSSGNKIVPEEQVSKAHERHEDENGIANLSDLDPEDEELFESARRLSQAKPVVAIPLPRNHKAKAVTVLTANANDAKDAMGKQEAGEKNAGRQEKEKTGSGKTGIENKVPKHRHHPHSPDRSLEELDAELEKMQSEAAKTPAKSGDHPFFGKRS